MNLNADIGEGYGMWQLGNDSKIMPLIDQANIACGFHAGDPLVMQNTIALAKQHGVSIGAHVSYPDLQGFGRRSMNIPKHELGAILHAQISTLDGMTRCQEAHVSYVKPHGALYNDMMKDIELYRWIVSSVSSYPLDLALVIQSCFRSEEYVLLAKKFGLTIILEGFVDRAYDDDGFLVSRQYSGAVLDKQKAISQAQTLINSQTVRSINGKLLDLEINTLCMHSDTTDALEICKNVRQLVSV